MAATLTMKLGANDSHYWDTFQPEKRLEKQVHLEDDHLSSDFL